MISARRVLEMARRWKKATVSGRRRISIGRIQSNSQVDCRKMQDRMGKGYFVVYTTDDRRFVIPLTYLGSPIMKELFRMSEDEFGLASNRPITFPCDGILMEYILSIIHRRMDKDVEKAVLLFMSTHYSSVPSLLPEKANLQIPICSF